MKSAKKAEPITTSQHVGFSRIGQIDERRLDLLLT